MAYKKMLKEKINHDMDVLEKLVFDKKMDHVENYIKIKIFTRFS